MIKLGSKVKDPITGFTGIAVVRSEWLWGCARVGVQSTKLKEDGTPLEPAWFDESRVEVIESNDSEVEKISDNPPGGPSREGRATIEG